MSTPPVMPILWSQKTVAELVDLNPLHLMRMGKEGRFPKYIKFGDKKNSSVRYIAAEVEAWIAERIAQRDAA